MSITAHTPAATRAATDPMRRTARIAGVLYLFSFASIPAAGQAELIAFHESAMETWRGKMRTYLRQAQSAGELTDGRPDERIIDAVPALTTGFQVNACFSPQHSTPERRMAVLDDLLAGVRGPGVT